MRSLFKMDYDGPPAITKKNYPHASVYGGWFVWFTKRTEWWASQSRPALEPGKIGPFASRKLMKAEVDRRGP